MQTKYARKNKRKQTRRRIKGGRPSDAELEITNAKLTDIVAYFKKNNRNPEEDENNVAELIIMTPYAVFHGRHLYNVVIFWIIDRLCKNKMFNMQTILLNSVIDRTIATNDQTLLTEPEVFDSIETLFIYQTLFQNIYTNEIVKLLRAVNPIRNIDRLDYLYNQAFQNLDVDILEALRDGNHVPLSKNHSSIILIMFRRIALTMQKTPEITTKINRFITVFNTIKPVAQTATLNLIYLTKRRGIDLPPDAIHDTHNILDNEFADAYEKYLRRQTEEYEPEY